MTIANDHTIITTELYNQMAENARFRVDRAKILSIVFLKRIPSHDIESALEKTKAQYRAWSITGAPAILNKPRLDALAKVLDVDPVSLLTTPGTPTH